ncbi:MAG: ABC transporter permease [Pseudomonadaceae bacterium]|nr:ABC transporter permease [Pseudomonadaceae bacterium]
MFARIASRLLTLLLVMGVIFLLIHLVPGDPVEALLGEQASMADREALRRSLRLDLPLGQQFADFLGGVVTGDWGTSMVRSQPVLGLMAERAPATVVLALAAMAVAVAVGGVAGTWVAVLASGIRRKAHDARLAVWLDRLLLALLATPTFCLGPLLMLVFAIWLGWLPVSGFGGVASLILPALTLGVGMGAHLARLLSASLQEELAADYLRTARAKGASGSRRLWHHALRNALVPVVIIFCLQLGMVLTGTVLTEAVFGWPGLGSLLVEALHGRDYPLVQGLLLLISLTYMAAVMLGDWLAGRLDPRLRAGAAR